VPVGDEFAVRTSETAPDPPSVCSRPNGGFMVARAEGGTGSSQVIARRFDAVGRAVGNDLPVSGVGYMSQADLACAADGSVAVVWSQGEDQDGIVREDIYARVIGGDGEFAGPAFLLNNFTTGRQTTPAVCSQGGGKFAAVWIDRSRDELDSVVFFDDARLRAREIVAQDPRAEVAPDIACADNGRFVIVWGDFPSKDRQDDVAARAFSSDGSTDGGRFYVNSYTTGDQTDAVVCAAGNGGFVVAWRHTVVSAGGSRIQARQLSNSGGSDGASFNVTQLGRRGVAITCGEEERSFVAVTTVDPTSGSDVFAQRFNANRTIAGDEIVAYPGNVSQRPRISGNADAKFPILWSTGSAPTSVSVDGRFFQRPDLTTTTSTTTTTTLPEPDSVCGDADESGTITAPDALAILRAAVGSQSCDPCRCDSDGSNSVTAADALRILQVAVGLDRELGCPACG